MGFQFKQFNIEDDRSSMKVGTDSVLLGSWVPAKDLLYSLEIGCGCGIISLMLAQKMKSFITAIDIDLDSVEQAKANFKNSKWSHQLFAEHISLQHMLKRKTQNFNLIVSNPPFFNNSLNSPDQKKTLSKHTNTLSYTDLAHGIKHLLTKNGMAYLILPYTEAKEFIQMMRMHKLYLNNQLIIQPKMDKAPNRLLMQFSFRKSNTKTKEIYLRNANGDFSKSYQLMCKDYYLNF